MMVDELEQKCYDLDSKVRLVEEERDSLVLENDELQEQISALKTLVEDAESKNTRGVDESTREEILRLGK